MALCLKLLHLKNELLNRVFPTIHDRRELPGRVRGDSVNAEATGRVSLVCVRVALAWLARRFTHWLRERFKIRVDYEGSLVLLVVVLELDERIVTVWFRQHRPRLRDLAASTLEVIAELTCAREPM